MERVVDDTLYSGPEACRAASISYRQLDYWDRAGVLTPAWPAQGSGSRRGYTLNEVVALAALGHLSSKSGRSQVPGMKLPRGMLAAVETGAAFIVRDPSNRREVKGIRDMNDLAALVCDGAVLTVLALGPIRERVGHILGVRDRDMVGLH